MEGSSSGAAQSAGMREECEGVSTRWEAKVLCNPCCETAALALTLQRHVASSIEDVVDGIGGGDGAYPGDGLLQSCVAFAA